MTFRSFAQEMYYRYVEECWDCQGIRVKEEEEYWADNKWFVRRKYREEHGKLQSSDVPPNYYYPGGDCQQ